MWRRTMSGMLLPAILAAEMKSCSRTDSSLLRTTRASPVQPISDTMMVMAKYTASDDQSGGSAALSAIHSGMVGNDMITSMTRCTAMSAAPPK